MRRSTFVSLGIAAFAAILATFIVRGTTRLVIGERASLLLATPFALVALGLVVVLFFLAFGEITGLYPMTDDLPVEDES